MTDDEKLDAMLGRLREPVPPEVLAESWTQIDHRLKWRKPMQMRVLDIRLRLGLWWERVRGRLPRMLAWERLGMPTAFVGVLLVAFMVGNPQAGDSARMWFKASGERMEGKDYPRSPSLELATQIVEEEEAAVEITDHMETEDKKFSSGWTTNDPDSMATFDSEYTGTPANMGAGKSGKNLSHHELAWADLNHESNEKLSQGKPPSASPPVDSWREKPVTGSPPTKRGDTSMGSEPPKTSSASGGGRYDLKSQVADLKAKIAKMESASMDPSAGGDAASLASMRKKGAITIGGEIQIDAVIVNRDDSSHMSEGDNINSTYFGKDKSSTSNLDFGLKTNPKEGKVSDLIEKRIKLYRDSDSFNQPISITQDEKGAGDQGVFFTVSPKFGKSGKDDVTKEKGEAANEWLTSRYSGEPKAKESEAINDSIAKLKKLAKNPKPLPPTLKRERQKAVNLANKSTRARLYAGQSSPKTVAELSRELRAQKYSAEGIKYERDLNDAEENGKLDVDKDAVTLLDWVEYPAPTEWRRLKGRGDYKVTNDNERIAEQLQGTRINVHFDQTALSDVLDELSQQAGVNLVLDTSVNPEETLSLKFNNTSLATTLKQILQAKGLAYTIRNEAVFIFAQPQKHRTAEAAWAYGTLINGRVNQSRVDGGIAAAPPEGEPTPRKNFKPQMVIKSAELILEVKRYKDTGPKVDAVVAQYGGFFADQRTTQNSNGTTSAYFVIRVPQRNFERLYAALKPLGEIKKESAKGDDVTAQFADTQARIRNQEYLEKRLLVLLDEKKANPKTKLSEILEVENQISNVREKVEAAKGRLRLMSDRIQFGTIRLRLEEPTRVMPKGALNIEVKDVPDADAKLDTIAKNFRAQILNRNTIQNDDGSRRLEATLKVNLPRFGALVDSVRVVGRVAQENITGFNPNAIQNDLGAKSLFTHVRLIIFEPPAPKPGGTATLEVKTLQHAATTIGATLKRLGGSVVRREEQHTGGTATATYTVRVPRAEFSSLDQSLPLIGRIINKKLSSVDVIAVGPRLGRVPCELTILIHERARQTPSAAAKISTKSLDTASAAVQKLVKKIDGQVQRHIEQRQPNGRSAASYTLLVRRSKFSALLAGLSTIGRVDDEQIRGLDEGEVAGAAADALSAVELTITERRAPVPLAVLEIIVNDAEAQQLAVNVLRRKYNAEIESNQVQQAADGSHKNVSRVLVPVAQFSTFLAEAQNLGTVRTKQVMGIGEGGGDAPDPKALARISITLVQRSARTVVPEAARNSIAGAFIEGWKSLKATTAFIINGLIVMLPWLLIIAALTFAVRRARRKNPAAPTAPEPDKK